MPKTVALDLFLQNPGQLIDVRSPKEYLQGHIPGSVPIPLFTDEERAKVGTTYKQQSRTFAIELGLEIVETKVTAFTESALRYLKQGDGKILCWRGGMRSGFMAHLFESLGFPCLILQGGYKAFRRWVLSQLNDLTAGVKPPKIFILGGLTGSGKTKILKELEKLGEQIIDLEQLACHRGSSFGTIGYPLQPSQEQFENELAFHWKSLDLSRPIWIEDESRMIGKCRLPSSLFECMAVSPFFLIERSLDERIKHLLDSYGHASQELLLQATHRLIKKLGMQLTREITGHIQVGQLEIAIERLLVYYDKTYHHHLSQRQSIQTVKANGICHLSNFEWAQKLQQLAWSQFLL